MSKEEIEKLQQLQKKRLENKKLSELLDEDQIEFCQTNKRIGELAYRAYKQTKQDPACALEAASYFVLAYEHQVEKVCNEFSLALSHHDANVTVDHIALSQQHEEIFLQGYCYLLGIGNYPKNIDKAAQLFEISAEKGVAKAQSRIGYMYENGYSVKQDKKEAYKWYLLAAKQDYAMGEFNLALFYCFGQDDFLKEDIREAETWCLRAAEQGYVSAQAILGDWYRQDGIIHDLEKASKYYLLAIEQGNANAQCNLGQMYYKGRVVKKNLAEARRLFLLSAEQDNKSAQHNLACLYENGDGVTKDMRASLRWYRLAAEQNKQLSIERLSKKDDVLTKYHAAMLEDDIQTILKLLIEEKSETVVDELRYDIKRAIKNHTLLKQIESLIKELKKQPVNIDMDTFASVLNHEYIKNLLEDHQEKQMNYEKYTKEDLKSTYVLLKNIDWSKINNNQIVPLVKLITDSWIQATEMNCEKIVSDASKYLTILIHQLKTIQLSGHDSPALQTGEMLLCASALIRQHFGREYEVVFSASSFKDLFKLLTFIEDGISFMEISQKFKDTVKKVTFNDEVMKNVIVLLKEYFTQYPEKISASPYLFGLNKCLTGIDEKINNQQEREKIIQQLFNYTSACRSAKKIFHQNLFAEDEVEGREIYYYLKNMKINELKSVLEKKREQAVSKIPQFKQ